MDNQESGKKSRVLIILLLLLLIIAAWFIYTEKNTTAGLKVDKSALEADLAEMVVQYETILEDKDSLDAELIAERDRILALRDSVSMLTDNVKLLERYRSEVRRIRREREDLLARADSLKAANDRLLETQGLIVDTLQAERMANEQLAEVNVGLQEKIKEGSALEALALDVKGIKIRSNGSEKPMTKASRVDKFKSCFTLSKNVLTEKGNKIVYLRIVNPNDMIEQGSNAEGNKLTLKDGSLVDVSEKKQVYYENKSIDMCIYVDAPEEPIVGEYKVEVYCEGSLIGTSNFFLEDSLF